MRDKGILVIYHKECMDGYAAGYAAWTVLGDTADYLAASYSDTPPCVDGKKVYILDFSYPIEVLKTLCQKAESITIIDHHIGVMPELVKYTRKNFNYFYDAEKSGCVMAWEFFNSNPVPQLFLHIQDQDLWEFKLPDTKTIGFGVAATPIVIFLSGMKWQLLLISVNT